MTNIKLRQLLDQRLQYITDSLEVDFSAIAFYDPLNLELRWRFAVGSLNDRYLKIVVRRDKGICGQVLKTKREVIVENFPDDFQDEAIEYPILIVEEIRSAVAMPIFLQSQLIGVLLIGQRQLRNFNKAEISEIKTVANEVLDIYLQGNLLEENRKILTTSSLSNFFLSEKMKRKESLNLILLDQRITTLPKEVQEQLVGIFNFLFDHMYQREAAQVSVISEYGSEQYYTIQIETGAYFELTESDFSKLAYKVRMINGSVDIAYEPDKTVFRIDFF